MTHQHRVFFGSVTLAPEVKVRFKRIHPSAVLPQYQTAGAAGADVSCVDDFTLYPGEYALVQTGLETDIPAGYEVQVRPRSGLAFKHGVTVLNAPGTIDSDYKGPLGVLLINHGDEPFVAQAGDRIAQIVVARVARAEFSETSDVGVSERGAGGFGSTGVAA